MSEILLKEILTSIQNLTKKIDRLEWNLLDQRLPAVDPTPEEQKIIQEYESDKRQGTLTFSKFV